MDQNCRDGLRSDSVFLFGLGARGERVRRVLVFGGRNYEDYAALRVALAEVSRNIGIGMLIHGGATGVDTLAGRWAHQNDIHVARVDALWNTRGRAAGSERNQAMLLLQPEFAVMFPGGSGTADMCRRLVQGGVCSVWEPYPRLLGAG